MQKSSAILGFVVAAALLGGAVFWVMSLNDGETPTPDVVEPADEGPIDRPITEIESQHQSMLVYPFHAFQQDVDELRNATPRTPDGKTWKDREHDYNHRIVQHKISVQMEDATIQEIVDHMKAEYAKAGLVITDLDMKIPDIKMSIFRVQVDAFEVIQMIQDQTKMLVTYAPTEFGTCIGTEAAVQEWYMRSNQRRIADHAAPELASRLLNPTFTLEVEGAHIGAIISKMTEDTGVEIITGPKVWNMQKRHKWKVDKPMKLRKGLQILAKKVGGFIRVKDDRVYLIKL